MNIKIIKENRSKNHTYYAVYDVDKNEQIGELTVSVRHKGQEYFSILIARKANTEEQHYIYDFSIKEPYRGNGIGSELLKKVKEDFSKCTLTLRCLNERLNFYERNGFLKCTDNPYKSFNLMFIN